MTSIQLTGMRSRREEPAGVYTVDGPGNGYTNHAMAHGHDTSNGQMRNHVDAPWDEYDTDSVQGKCTSAIERLQATLSELWEDHGEKVMNVIYLLLAAGYFTYFGFAMSTEKLSSEESIRLLWMTCFAIFIAVYSFIKKRYGTVINDVVILPLTNVLSKYSTGIKWVVIALAAIALVLYIIIAVAIKRPQQLVSLAGYMIYILIFYVLSSNPAKVKWQPVVSGLGLQVFFAFLVMRTEFGFAIFKWLGDRASEFLEYSDEGAEFVFGKSYQDHFFAFKVLPVVVFFSTVISVLYYLGVMQVIILKLAWIMTKTMGTTPAESVNAAGNIFVGQNEAPLLIKPLLNKMTESELHAVMTGGFATIAGSVLASYILFGVPANHLLTASVMAAPCALAMSKLFYPETESTAQTEKDVAAMELPKQSNVIEAASAGASAAVPVVANVAANLIAFIAILKFVNSTLTWLGDRVEAEEEVTFQLICSYVLWPFAYIMGVASQDCRKVGELIGVKMFINEFVAYDFLGNIIEDSKTFNAYNGTWVKLNHTAIYLNGTNTTLSAGVMEHRSQVISTYALCGFANIGSIGMVMGGLGSMAPSKTSIISRLALRAMIAGTVVSFMNACIAGLLYQPEE